MAKEIKIDKRIPIPKTRRKRPTVDYPFQFMKMGDSLLLQDEDYFRYGALKARAIQEHNVKLTVRTTKEGLRVWRVA